MCVIIKARCFYGLPLLHNQNYKNSVHYSWEIYQEKLATKFNKVSWWVLWIGDPINFHNSFFVKNYYLNLNFFQALQSALLKNETKNLLKKDASQIKIAWQLTFQETEVKHLRMRKKNENWEKVKQQLCFFYVFIGRLLFC